MHYITNFHPTDLSRYVKLASNHKYLDKIIINRHPMPPSYELPYKYEYDYCVTQGLYSCSSYGREIGNEFFKDLVNESNSRKWRSASTSRSG